VVLLAVDTVTDAGYYVGYLLCAVGAARLVRGRVPQNNRAALIDAAIVFAASGVLLWEFVVHPQLVAYVGAPVELVVFAACPVLLAATLAMSVRFVQAWAARLPSFWLLWERRPSPRAGTSPTRRLPTRSTNGSLPPSPPPADLSVPQAAKR
jgi:hypothetical protein